MMGGKSPFLIIIGGIYIYDLHIYIIIIYIGQYTHNLVLSLANFAAGPHEVPWNPRRGHHPGGGVPQRTGGGNTFIPIGCAK